MSQINTIQQNAAADNLRKAIKRKFPQTSAKVLFKALKKAVAEKDVENAWRDAFSEYFVKNSPKDEKAVMTSPYKVDGFISTEGNLVIALRLLMEFKYKTDLSKSYDRARIMCQCVHYMKKFQEGGDELPNVIVGADEDQAFVLVANKFYKYLSGDYDWSVAPNEAYQKDSQLMKDLLEDKNLEVYPFTLSGGNFKERYSSVIDLFEAIDSIKNDNGQGQYKVKVSPATILGMFDRFNHLAFREPENVKPVSQVNIFMQMLMGKNEDEYYFIPRNHNLYHLPGDKKIKVFGYQIEVFLNHYDRNFTPKEIDKLTSIADTLIEANARRFKGDFWTPTIWAKRADQIMQSAIGSNYKEEALVWDCAAGVRNLTRDFTYNDLYISTYHEDEIELGDGYNPEAKEAFQYDFLNDDVDLTPANNPNPDDWKMPNSLFNDLKDAAKTNKKVIFYTNPPYGTANNFNDFGNSKAKIAMGKMNTYMRKNKYGSSSQQLYAQFIARVIKLTDDFNLKNVYIAFFTNTRYMNGGKYWKQFNTKLFSKFSLQEGNMFNAGEFSDTSNSWPITFSVYKQKADDNVVQVDDSKSEESPVITLSVEESVMDSADTSTIRKIRDKSIVPVYAPDDLSTWVREPIEDVKTDYVDYPYPQLGSAMGVSKGKKPSGSLLKNSLGYMVFNSDNVAEGSNNGGVFIVSASAYKGHGLNVLPQNFDRAVVGFAARRSVKPTWINAQDNYVKPDVSSDIYSEYVNDALIFSLFDNASNQAAYRNDAWSNTNVKGKWANEWFWLPLEYVREKVEDIPALSLMYDDMRGDKDRFVAKEIAKRTFSNEAQNVLKYAKEVWLDTLEQRPLIWDDYPEFYLQAWDAGWFQIKQIQKKFNTDNYARFQDAFASLKDKLEQNTYKLGMLLDR